MDSGFIARILFLVVIGGVLLLQTRRYADQPNRKRAFQLSAGAMFCFAGFTFSIGSGAMLGPIQQFVAIAGMLLMMGAVVFLALSLRGSERAADRASIAQQAEAFRSEREKALAEKEQK